MPSHNQSPIGAPFNLPNLMEVPMPIPNVSNGRNVNGDNVVYDIDVRLPGEVMPPQLEVTPITKYASDPELMMGRQIAVNDSYICYGLKQGAVRVLDVNTGLRSLLKGLTQRVTDMAFFAEDVPLLASASIDGRVYVWKITEIPDEEPQITGKIVIAVQIVGEGESVHPRVCWHCHKQEVLVVGIERRILKIDTTKVGRGEVYSADDPLKCHVDKLINGIQFVGNHDGEVTDLSMCQWMITRLVSASVDGTIKIWQDRKSTPIAVLRPYDGQPVNSVTFLTAPHRPDHIILITGGPLNREVKIWASESEEGWLLPSDADSWHCTQTLELKSSTESKLEDSFFNQVVALSQPGLLLLANAKKNAIYAVHLEYGLNPETTRMDYISEFTVTMPILSLTGASQLLPHGEIINVYCVQTQAIQQYALDLSRCLPPPVDGVVYDKSNLSDAMITEGFTGLDPLCSITNDADNSSVVSPAAPLSPRLSRKLSNYSTLSGGFESSIAPEGYRDQNVIECAVDRQIATALSNLSNFSNLSTVSSVDNDSKNGDNKAAKDDNTIKFKHPTHLVTPAELMATSPSDIQDVVENSDPQNVDMDVKIVGETGKSKSRRQSPNVDGLKQLEGTEETVQILDARDEVQDMGNNLVGVKFQALKGKKQKGKKAQGSGSSSPSLSFYNSMNSSIEQGVVSNTSSTEPVFSQIRFMQETIAQVLINQKEIQKQMPVLLTVPITKEGRRIETAIGKTMEKAYKATSNVQWDRTQEEFIKQESANQNRHQQISGLVTNGLTDLLVTWEKMLKKEMAALLPGVVRSVTPIIEKTVASAISEAFQRGISDKAVNQLEKSAYSKLEAIVARQIQSQFQTSGKQALQETLRLSMEESVVPAFEMSCKAMLDQVDATFQNGIIEHKTAARQQVESIHSPLAIALRDTINSASSMTRTLTNELADGQRKLVALSVAGATSKARNPTMNQISNGSIDSFRDKIEARVDPTKELSRLINERKYQEAFITALQRSDVSSVSWLCSQVNIQRLLTSKPLPLSQGVLLSLLQQLACDIINNTSQKLSWMMNLVMEIKPSDSMIAMHVRPIFDQVYSILNHQVSLPTTSVSEMSSIRIVMRLMDPVLRSLTNFYGFFCTNDVSYNLYSCCVFIFCTFNLSFT